MGGRYKITLIIHIQLFKGPPKANSLAVKEYNFEFGVLTLPGFQPYHKNSSNQNYGTGPQQPNEKNKAQE